MAFTGDQAFVNQYGSNVFHLAQQKASRLKPFVRTEMQKAEIAFYDRLAAQEPVERTTRHADTPILEPEHSRRGVILKDYELANLIDDQDKIRSLIDPTNSYVMSQAAGFGRHMDRVILQAALGPALVGKSAGQTLALPDSQRIVAVDTGAASNFNIETLFALKGKFDAADVDPSIKRYIAVTSSMIMSLLREDKISSSDFASVKALVRGEINEFMGFTFIQTELVPSLTANVTNVSLTTGEVGAGASTITAAANKKRAVAWAGGDEGGLLLAIGKDITARISERDDKSYATQAYTCMTIGGTRLEDTKVVEVIVTQ